MGSETNDLEDQHQQPGTLDLIGSIYFDEFLGTMFGDLICQIVWPGVGDGNDEGEHPPQGCFSRLKRAAKRLQRNVYALHLAVQDPACGWAPRVLAVIVVAYAVSPIDLIPDFIPVLGILDDLLLLPGLIWLAIHLIPEDVWQHALQRADEEPLLLAHNWMAAAAIFIVWDALLLFAVYMAVMHFGAPYWRQRWYIWVIVVGALLAIAEVGWVVYQLQQEKRAADARQKRRDEISSLLADDPEVSLDVCSSLSWPSNLRVQSE